jgi:hypothetical protein
MVSAGQDKELIRELYTEARAQFQRDPPTQDVAKGLLILVSSEARIPSDGCFTALSEAVSVLNKTALSRPFSKESAPSGELASWVRWTTPTRRLEEILDLTERIGSAFQEAARRDATPGSIHRPFLFSPSAQVTSPIGGGESAGGRDQGHNSPARQIASGRR